mgnify:FL=1
MGQKVNPHGFRVGVIKDWDSRWYASNEKVGDLLVEDHKIRVYLKKLLFAAGVSKIEIERSNEVVTVYLHVARPGVVIGKGGVQIEEYRKSVEKLIGKTVKNAVKKALAKQSGLTPAKQHDVFRRLKRFDIKPGDMWQAYSAQDAAVVKPEYLLAAEKLAKEDIMLVYTSLYAHLLDQHLWELISAKEMQMAGQKLLQAIAEQYNVEAEIINEGTLASMLASWQQQFNKIITQRLHQTAKES